MSRDALIAAFLGRHGYGAARAAPLAQDASFRRYLRLTGGPRPVVLMDAPPPEDIRPFVRIAGHLAGIGVSVPEIIAADEGEGLLLEEDLGDGLFPLHLARLRERSTRDSAAGEGACAEDRPSPGSLTRADLSRKRARCTVDASALFTAAVDVLATIQHSPPPPNLPVWDAAAMASTALGTLFDWWWPAMFGAPAPDRARQDFADALAAMLAPVAAGPTCFVHRDYFAGNLLWLPDRPGLRRVGVLDFQSAAIGHPAYDLASLLQDARRDIPTAIAESAIAHYLAARPELDSTAFRAAYAACAAQRHLRVATQWVRLARRDGRPGYLVHGPRTWRLLEQAVRQPAAAPLAAALDRWIPPARRANPPDRDA
jgi:N-acetylmuramate 1-kinase